MPTPMHTAAAQDNTVGGALLGGAAGAIIGGAATGRAGGAVAGGIDADIPPYEAIRLAGSG